MYEVLTFYYDESKLNSSSAVPCGLQLCPTGHLSAETRPRPSGRSPRSLRGRAYLYPYTFYEDEFDSELVHQFGQQWGRLRE